MIKFLLILHFTCNCHKNMQHIKCGQREQSLGQKALWDHDCTFYPFFYPFWDQCQEVTAGKSAEQRRRRGRGRGAQTPSLGLISVSTQKHSAPPGHQAYFALPLFSLSILFTCPTPLSCFLSLPSLFVLSLPFPSIIFLHLSLDLFILSSFFSLPNGCSQSLC